VVVRDFVGGALVGFFVVTSVLGLPVGDSIGMLVEEPFLEGNMVGDSLVANHGWHLAWRQNSREKSQ
jgi:hypothetical protein